jgi:phage replication-related protein YjqB (UPF0714/DUF867 family)
MTGHAPRRTTENENSSNAFAVLGSHAAGIFEGVSDLLRLGIEIIASRVQR